MPIFKKINLKDQSIVGIWEITEDVDELLSMAYLSPEEKHRFNLFQSQERKKQWLSYRILLNNILISPLQNISVYYNQYGKPFINPYIGNISITHSGKFSGIILSKKNAVGIDIEKISSRITNISHKFLSKNEEKEIDLDNYEQLTIYWCAKEAIYKLHGLRNIIFKENIIIKPFYNGINEGTLSGVLQYNEHFQNINLCFKKINDYILVFTIDN